MTKKQAMKKFKSMLPELKEAMIKDADDLLNSKPIDLSLYETDEEKDALVNYLMRTSLLRQSWEY